MSTTPTPAPTLVAAEQGKKGARRRVRRTTPPKERPAPWSVRIALAVVVMIWLIPTIGLLVTSFRPASAAVSTGWWSALAAPLQNDWSLDNYDEVLSAGMGNAFVNSFVVTIPATIIPILIAAMAAYSFAFMEFRGRDVYFILVVGLLVVPVQVAFIPLLRFFGDVGLVGTFASVWLVHAGFAMPLAIFILRSYMATLPRAVIESAKIDGASHFQTFWRLIIPMSVPALAAFAIFQFMWVWNDLLIALLFIGAGRNEVVTVNLSSLIGQFGQRWDLLTAGGFVTMAVPLLVFFALQRYFVRGMTAGAVKG